MRKYKPKLKTKSKSKKFLIAALLILVIVAGIALITLKKVNKRASYGLPAAMFEKLPAIPTDFEQVKILLLYNKIRDYTGYGPEYWKQPEWFPSWNEGCLPLLKNPPLDRWAAMGVGTFPYKATYSASPGETVKAVLYVKSGCMVVTYQGVGMKYGFPESARRLGDEIFYQTPSTTAQYLKIKSDPEEFILEPSYPVFSEEYAKRIEIDIEIDPNTPPGFYFVAIDPGAPSGEFSDEAYRTYLTRYTPATMAITGQHRFTVFIDVV